MTAAGICHPDIDNFNFTPNREINKISQNVINSDGGQGATRG